MCTVPRAGAGEGDLTEDDSEDDEEEGVVLNTAGVAGLDIGSGTPTVATPKATSI